MVKSFPPTSSTLKTNQWVIRVIVGSQVYFQQYVNELKQQQVTLSMHILSPTSGNRLLVRMSNRSSVVTLN